MNREFVWLMMCAICGVVLAIGIWRIAEDEDTRLWMLGCAVCLVGIIGAYAIGGATGRRALRRVIAWVAEVIRLSWR